MFSFKKKKKYISIDSTLLILKKRINNSISKDIFKPCNFLLFSLSYFNYSESSESKTIIFVTNYILVQEMMVSFFPGPGFSKGC